MHKRTDTTVQDARPWTVARDILPMQRTPWRIGDLLRRRGAASTSDMPAAVVAH